MNRCELRKVFLFYFMRIFSVVLLFFLFFSVPLFSQFQTDSVQSKTFLGIERKPIMKYGMIAYSAASFYVEYQWWWKGNYHPFIYENDGFWNNYSFGVDKFGHFYISYFYFSAVYELMLWAEFDERDASLIAFLMPFSHALSIEIGDGFSTFAFSGPDLAANVLGIGYGLLQRNVPYFQHFKFKWSYYPSGIIPFDGKFRITDDYDGHIYWLSLDVHNIIPSSIREYWPRFLNLAVGYGGKNISGRPQLIGDPISSPGAPNRKWAVSLDYNLSSLEINNDVLNVVKNIVDYFKFPSPGIKIIENEQRQLKPLLVN